ncbi:MAG: 6-phosphofructokinase [Planctomycetes bacterium]|nr:6-phosphofructokinase [Planctomycetota bacterium]
MKKPRIGILCGGGPAPGINSVISAATIEAVNSGFEVVGIRDGFKHLIAGAVGETELLTIPYVSRIQATGGSILGIARDNPTVKEPGAADPGWRMTRTVQSIRELGLDALLTIGGDGTAHSAQRTCEAFGGKLPIVHVPKTIDNDLPLPGGKSTFGFQTARHVGAQIVENLMTDAYAARRWFFVVAMGRSAGHLALGIAKAAGATLAVIPEEFERDLPIRLDDVVDVLDTAMLKRQVSGRPFGVAVLAEGIALRLTADDIARVQPDCERDAHDNLRLSELHLHRLLTRLVKERFKARGQEATIVAKSIGYELRCAHAIPFDIEYTRDLGCGAVEYMRQLMRGQHAEAGGMVAITEGHLAPMPFGSFNDPKTGRTLVRQVDITTESYKVARKYMIRLEKDDLADPAKLAALAAAAKLPPEAFVQRYRRLVELPGAQAATR